MELPSYCSYDHVDNFVVTKNFLSPKECDVIVEMCLEFEFEEAQIRMKQKSFGKNDDIRLSNISHIDPNNPEFAWLLDRVADTITEVNREYFKFDIVGFQEELQFAEYKEPGGHYSYHTDKLLHDKVRKLSMVVQLTDPSKYEGGELEICLGEDPFVVPKQQGTLVTFPSYNLHRVKPTTKGTRHSLVGWVTGRPFR